MDLALYVIIETLWEMGFLTSDGGNILNFAKFLFS